LACFMNIGARRQAPYKAPMKPQGQIAGPIVVTNNKF